MRQRLLGCFALTARRMWELFPPVPACAAWNLALCSETMFNRSIAALLLLLCVGVELGLAQGTAFTYQGRLSDNGSAANGDYDLAFSIYDAVTNGSLVAGTLTNRPVAVTNGIFTVSLDFGAGVFDGRALWLQLGVRTNGSGAAYTLLNPAQPLKAAPYAITAGNVPGGATGIQLVTLSNATFSAMTSLSSTNETRHQIFSGGLTLTNAPLIFQPTPFTNSDGYSLLWSAQPMVSNQYSGNFGLNMEGSYFNGDFDNVATLGWNQSGGGQRVNPSAPAMWLQWEHYFHQYNDPYQAQSEFHLDYIDLNGNSDRPFMFQQDVTNLNNWQAIFVNTQTHFKTPMSNNLWLSLSPGSMVLSNPRSSYTNGLQLYGGDANWQINPYPYESLGQELYFGGNWAYIALGANVGIYSNGTINCGSISASGPCTFNGNYSQFNAEVRVTPDVSISGNSSSFGAGPYLKLTDNATDAATRSWAFGHLWYNGFGGDVGYGSQGHFTFAVSSTQGGTGYGSGSIPVLDLYSNQVTVVRDLMVGGVGKFNNGVWLPNTNIITAASAFAVATNQPLFAITIAVGNQYAYVTNAVFTTNTFLQATVNSDDATASSVAAIPTNGYCTLKLNAVPTGDVRVSVSWQNP